MIILRKDFQVLNSKKIYTPHFFYQSWYSPIFLRKRTDEDDDESCCITFQVRKDGDDKKYLVLANILMPNRLNPHNVLTHVRNLNNDFTNNTLKEVPSRYSQKCVIIPANENDVNTFSIEVHNKNIPVHRLFIERNGGDLQGLVHRAINMVSQSRFCLIVDSKNENILRAIDERFLDIIIRHPSKDSYALSYAWAQGIVFGERHLSLFEEKDNTKRVKKKHNFYGIEG